MTPTSFDFRYGGTIQPDLASQFPLAEASGLSAGRDAGPNLNPCLLICHGAIIALLLACLYTERARVPTGSASSTLDIARTTQSALARISGVRQPSISQFLAGKLDLSDDQLDRLLACVGYCLEVTRRPVEPALTRSERRSWLLHRHLSTPLSDCSDLERWRPVIERNLQRLRGSVRGQPQIRNLDRWAQLAEDGDVPGPAASADRPGGDSIEMREVSPMSGRLPPDERLAVLGLAS